MTCRHAPGDPDCGKSPYQQAKREREAAEYRDKRIKELEDKLKKPDNSNFEILDSEEVKGFLILKVRYPSCKDCSFEGTKVMVFQDATLKDAIKWRTIDPHFRDEAEPKNLSKAPSPIARFPNTDLGWKIAINLHKSIT